jgi:Lon protease-like protein
MPDNPTKLCHPGECRDCETRRAEATERLLDEHAHLLDAVVTSASPVSFADFEPMRHTASTITDDALDALYAELERTGRLLRRAQARARHWQGRAERYRQAWKSASRDRRTLTNELTRRAPLLGQSQAAIDRARKLASRWAVLRAYGSAATELRAALDGPEPCEQHSHAPTFDGLCGGCTQYPTDLTPETRRA